MKIKSRNSLLFHTVAILISIIMAYPLLWMFSSSLKPNEEIFVSAHQLIPSEIRLENYANGWEGMGGNSFGVFFSNSFIVAVFATIGSVLSSSLVAFGFARLNFKFKRILFAIMISTMMLPEQILIVPQYIIFRTLGWTNTFLPLIVPFYCSVPFFVFLNMQFLRGIPKELDEAASIDGCSKLSIYARILFPLSLPASSLHLYFRSIGGGKTSSHR